MSKYFFQNEILRSCLLSVYRGYARTHFWRNGERVFVNSIPKAGTHLATAVLTEVPGLMHSQLHVDMWQVHSGPEVNGSLEDFRPCSDRFRRLLSGVRGGQIVTGHLPWHPVLFDVLREMQFKTIFVSRNADDIVESNLHYIGGLRRHFMHDRLIGDFATEADRRKALMLGIPARFVGDDRLIGTADLVQGFLGWSKIADPAILHLTFEELIGERGGGSHQSRLDCIARVLAFLGKSSTADNVGRVHRRSLNKKSFTFRSGRINSGKSAA
jgi:hypothetical protein